ncbi:MAG: hypothetical protein HBSAPP03_20170 [Phycisphaerae bacterium]|nr:MAG: hypothetical protein HBSAPP03_20170 [Phycisphaerae bacterium]
MKWYLSACVLGLGASTALGQLRIATWNISAYDGTTRAADIQRAVYGTFNGQRMAPDVLCVQEVESASALNTLRTVLNTAPGYPNPPADPGSPGDWQIATFVNGPDTESVLLYRTSRVVLVRDTTIIAVGVANDLTEQPRHTYRWDIRPYGYGAIPANSIGVYGVHLKSGSTSDDNARRLVETTRIRNNAAGIDTNGPGTGLPAGYHFLVLGDFNIQTSTQSAYQQLVASQSNNAGRFFDPIARPGSWNNNGMFAVLHTQDPIGAGGMDDRHDQILLSGSLLDLVGLDYVGTLSAPQTPVAWNLATFADPNHSYRAYGNDGTSFDANLTITNNQMVGSAIAQSLVNVCISSLGPAGHLPVYLDLRVPAVADATPSLDFGTVVQGSPSVQRTLQVGNAGDVARWNASGIAALNYSMAYPTGFAGPGGNHADPAGGSFNAHTIFMSTATLGPRSGSITITTNDPERPTILVPVTGMVVPPNASPIAHAGPDQNLVDLDNSGAELITLDGSASTDPDGSIVQYEWKNGAVTIASGPSPSANVVLAVGEHLITLTVTDNGGLTDDDTVLITIAPPPCDADVNCDGAINGLDVEVQELAVGGDLADYCLPEADFNQDGAVNGLDVEAVELVVGGASCP